MELHRNVCLKKDPIKMSFSCVSCDKIFSEFNDLRKHKRGHSAKPFKCPQCDKNFSDFGALMNHKKLCTSDRKTNTSVNIKEKAGETAKEKPFKCQKRDKKFTDCNVLSWNIDKGLTGHLTEIIHVLNTEDIGICFLSEVDDKKRNLESTAPTEVLPNYSAHAAKCKDKSDKVRIMALIRNDIPFKIREDLMSSRVQTIWIEIVRKNSKNILVGGVYRTWSDDQDGDADIILDQFEKATEENLPVAILGDMNLDTKKWAKKNMIQI